MADLTAESLEGRLASLDCGDLYGFLTLPRLFPDTEPMEAPFSANRGRHT